MARASKEIASDPLGAGWAELREGRWDSSRAWFERALAVEETLRELFGDRVESLALTRRHYVERAPDPTAYRELFKQTFGPVVATYASLADEPERLAALDRDFLELATRANSGPPGGPAEYRYEYLLVIARKRGA